MKIIIEEKQFIKLDNTIESISKTLFEKYDKDNSKTIDSNEF